MIGIGGLHQPVAMLFGDDARGGYARLQCIAANDGARGLAPLGQPVAVDQNRTLFRVTLNFFQGAWRLLAALLRAC